MDLGEAGIAKQGSATVRPPDGRGIRSLGIVGEVKHIAVSAGLQHNEVADMVLDLSCRQVAGDDATRLSVNQYHVEHLGAGVHRHRAGGNLFLERLVSAQQQLLSCLSARIEGALNLHSAKRAGIEQAAVLPSK